MPAFFSLLLSIHFLCFFSSFSHADIELASTESSDDSIVEVDNVDGLETRSVTDVLLNVSSRYFSPKPIDYEVAGFTLRKDDSETFIKGIPDLDVALNQSGERYIPLTRMLAIFDVSLAGNKDIMAFQGENDAPSVEINFREKILLVNDEPQVLDYISGMSDITQKRDIYLPSALIAELFNVSLVWLDELYEFEAITDAWLSIWRSKGGYRPGQDAEEIEDLLPELFDEVSPHRNSLDFLRLRVGVNYRDGENDLAAVRLNTAQDLYGGLFGGHYEFRFSQPSISFTESGSGTSGGFDSGEGNLSVPDFASWTNYTDQSRVTVGDASFGVSNLVLPFISTTGFRIEGNRGAKSTGNNEIAGYGLNRSFDDIRRFEGNAELGSEVRLFINDVEIQTAEVYEEPDSPPGFGKYEFNEVSIPRGTIVAVRIEIEEPGGRRIVLDKSTTNSGRLQPVGELGYVAGAGTERDDSEWRTQGVVGGGRFLYGLFPRLTIGASAGIQDGVIRADTGQSSANNTDRLRADKSEHAALEFVYNPFNPLFISGDFATSDGSRDEDVNAVYSGDAFRLRVDLLAHKRARFFGGFLNYDRGFYDGINSLLEDRQAYYLVAGTYFPKLNLTTTYGSVENNLDASATETRQADYFNVNAASSSIIRGLYLSAEYDAIMPDGNSLADKERKDSVSANLRTNIIGFDISASIEDGDLVNVSQSIRELFQNIALPNVSVTGNSSSALAISRALKRHRFVVELDGPDTDIDQRSSLTHYWESNAAPGSGFLGLGSTRVVNEFRYNKSTHLASFSTQWDLYLDARRRNRIGISTRWDENIGVSWNLDFNFSAIFAVSGRKFSNFSASSIAPSRGGIKGTVFLDKNANGIKDKREPGIPNIRVRTDNERLGSLSNEDGSFFVGRESGQDDAQVYVDIETVPAILVPIHAKQKAQLKQGLYSKVDFAFAPLVALTGTIERPKLPYDKNPEDESNRPIDGARLQLTNPDGNVVGESVTASDGSYYFNAVPGVYQIWVDPQTVHPRYLFNQPAFELRVVAAEEYQELDFEPIVAEIIGAVESKPTEQTSENQRAQAAVLKPEQVTDRINVQPDLKADIQNKVVSESEAADIENNTVKPLLDTVGITELARPTIDTTKLEAKLPETVALKNQDLNELSANSSESTDVLARIKNDVESDQPITVEQKQVIMPAGNVVNLTQPKISLPTPIIKRPAVRGIANKVTGQFLGETTDRENFEPIQGARLFLETADGERIESVVTDKNGEYSFEASAGEYQLVVDPETVALHYVYDEPARTFKLFLKDSAQKVTLEPILANYLNLSDSK